MGYITGLSLTSGHQMKARLLKALFNANKHCKSLREGYYLHHFPIEFLFQEFTVGICVLQNTLWKICH